MSETERMLAANADYAERFHKGDLAIPPARRVAVVTCMDARIETAQMLGLEVGAAHIIRNAGGIVTDDVIRSLMISQHLLGTREVLVIQHTGCGMLSFTDSEFRDKFERETGKRPTFEIGSFADLEGNLRGSVERIRSSPFVAETDAVHGFVFEVETGRLREVR